MTAAVVGKGGYRAGNLAGIGNLVLEILMLVLALKDKVLYIVALLYHMVLSQQLSPCGREIKQKFIYKIKQKLYYNFV